MFSQRFGWWPFGIIILNHSCVTKNEKKFKKEKHKNKNLFISSGTINRGEAKRTESTQNRFEYFTISNAVIYSDYVVLLVNEMHAKDLHYIIRNFQCLGAESFSPARS